jgi:hypothetical protein
MLMPARNYLSMAILINLDMLDAGRFTVFDCLERDPQVGSKPLASGR